MIIRNSAKEIVSIQHFACFCAKKLTFICWEKIVPYFIEYAESLEVFSFFISFEIEEKENLIPFTSFYSDCTFVYPTNIHMSLMNCVLQSNCILFNCEQMSIVERYDQTMRFLENGGKLIDYSHENCEILMQKYSTEQICYLPYRCTVKERDFLKKLLQEEKKEFDVAVVASMTPRRVRIVDFLRSNGITVCVIKQTFGIERDRMICRCRCLLNIHANENYTIFETLRCCRWLDAGMRVMTEPCQKLDDSYHPNLKIVKECDLVAACQQLADFPSTQCSIETSNIPIDQISALVQKSLQGPTKEKFAICYGAKDRFWRVSTEENPAEITNLINKDDAFNNLYGDPKPNIEKNYTILFNDATITLPEKRNKNYLMNISNSKISIELK